MKVSPTVKFETAVTGFAYQLDARGWRSAWAAFVNRDVNDVHVHTTDEVGGLQASYTIVTTIITISATQAAAIQRLISHAMATNTLESDLHSLLHTGGPLASATFSEPVISAIVTHSMPHVGHDAFVSPPPPYPSPPPPSRPPPPPPSVALPPPPPRPDAPPELVTPASGATSGTTASVPIGAIVGAVAGAVVMSVMVGLLVYKKMRLSQPPRATLASPVPVEMMPSAAPAAAAAALTAAPDKKGSV